MQNLARKHVKILKKIYRENIIKAVDSILWSHYGKVNDVNNIFSN